MSNLYPSLILLRVSAALGSVRADSLKESSSNYSCCENPTIEFDQSCAARFHTNNMIIADSSVNECVAPCKKIEAGRMTLDQCVDVKMILVYTEGSMVTEERIDLHGLHGLPCSGSNNMAAGNHGPVGSLLLVLGIAGLLIC